MEQIENFKKQLAQYKMIGIDSNILIYLFEEHPQFNKFSKHLFNLYSEKKVSLVMSVIAVSELFVRPLQALSPQTIAPYEILMSALPDEMIMPVDYPIAKLASFYRAEYNFLLLDAIHLATAVFHKADAFITNDKKLKKIPDIPVLVLSDFL